MSTNPNIRKPNTPAPPEFVMSPAKFLGTSLLIGFVSPSGGGKTKSSLEIARGIQVVTGGKIGILDTENGRSLHYADEYQFKLPDGTDGLYHLPLDPPFNPARYQAAYEFMVKQGIKIIITDSFSHEHDGIGGVLEMHEEDLKTMKDPSAWGRAKGERRELVSYILQVKNVHWLFAFRAKEKMRWIRGQAPEARGLMPQGNEQFLFEQTCSFLLPAGANGVPVLSSPYPDEELILKTPAPFRHLFTEPRQLSAALGTHLAAWAVPSWKGTLPPLPAPMKRGQSASVGYSATMAKSIAAAPMTVAELIAKFETITDLAMMGDLRPAFDAVRATSTPADAARLVAAKDACYDRLDPIDESAKTEPVETPAVTPATAPVVAPVTAVTTPVATAPVVVQRTRVDDLVTMYENAVNIAAVDALEGQTKALLDVSSEADCARIRAAANAALDRLEPTEVVSPTATPAAPVDLSDIQKLNAAGLARFREALASFEGPITQVQAGQLVRDHLADYAPTPKVGTEDGAQAQDEIMKRTEPPFKTRASLGVMRRHLEQIDWYPSYRAFFADLALCMTAENAFEAWILHEGAIDALPKEVAKDTRDRTGRFIEELDEKITQGGPWLTKRLKEHRVKTGSTTTASASPVSSAAPAASPAAVILPTAPATPNEVHVHKPVSSDVGQKIALDLDKAVGVEATQEVGVRISRAKLQKRIPDDDYNTLSALLAVKMKTFEAATA